jgi:hypothetical protein
MAEPQGSRQPYRSDVFCNKNFLGEQLETGIVNINIDHLVLRERLLIFHITA